MSLAQLLNRPCTITHLTDGVTQDEYGNDVPDEATADTVCELQQRQRTETPDGSLARATWSLVLPAGTVIASGDTVTVDDTAYEVHGDPWPARNPRTGEESHVEATVILTGGTDEGASRAS